MRKTNWPYAATTIVVIAIQTGWRSHDILLLTTTLLVLIGLVATAGNNPPD